MNARKTTFATFFIFACLPVLLVLGAENKEAKILEAKLRMRFALDFELEDTKGMLFAFQQGVSEKCKKQFVIKSVYFNNYFADLVGHKGNMNKGLKVVIFDTKSTYNKKFSASGLFGHYHTKKKIIYTYKNSGYGTLFHELAHHYIRVVYGQNVPLWFDEGLASYFEKRVKGNFGATNWRLPSLKKALKNGKYISLEDILDGKTRDDGFFLAQVRHFFVYLDHLGALKDFLLDVKKENDFSKKSRIEELTHMTLTELDEDFRKKIKIWKKNSFVGSSPEM